MTDESTEVVPEVAQEVAADTTPTETQPATETQPVEPVADATPEPVTEEAKEEETPEWFMKDKYKSVEEQAKSAFELQKKMGKYWGSPSDDYSLEGIEGVAKDDPLLSNLVPAIKELGLSQEGLNHLAKQYMDANTAMVKTFEEALKKELTVDNAQSYRDSQKWMGENLTAEETQLVQNNWLMTPADFKLFNNLRLMAAPKTNVPSAMGSSATKFESSKEVENDKITYRKELKEKIRVVDRNHEDDLARRFREARTRETRSL